MCVFLLSLQAKHIKLSKYILQDLTSFLLHDDLSSRACQICQNGVQSDIYLVSILTLGKMSKHVSICNFGMPKGSNINKVCLFVLR